MASELLQAQVGLGPLVAENASIRTSSYLQSSWTWFYEDLAGGDEMYLWTVFFLVSFLFFWTFNIGFMFLELTGKPSYLLKYRVQINQKPAVVDRAAFLRCVRGVLYNQLVIGLPFHFAVLPLVRRRGLYGKELPSLPNAIVDLVVCGLALEVGFYYTHRILHIPFFYKRYHKIHHEWKTPISICSIYCHQLEYFVSNLLPLVAGPIAMGSHYTVALFWVLVSSGSGSIAHSGYHMPFLPSNETHDFHHAQFNQIYGMLGILDVVHGTNSHFKKTLAYARHFMLKGTTPAYILIPDRKQ